MNETWINETKLLIDQLRVKKEKIQMRIEIMQSEMNEIDRQISGGIALIKAYMQNHNLSLISTDDISPNYFGSMPYSEMLIEIAKRTSGYLKVKDAIELMYIAKVNPDKRVIQSNIYGTLKRMKNKLKKEKRGEYILIDGNIEKSVNVSVAHDRVNNGVAEEIKKLKESNPSITKEEALQLLIKNNFNFKGKKPTNSVTMAWVKLGYSKHSNQQASLLPMPMKGGDNNDLKDINNSNITVVQ